jgi:hypothetical protein
MEGEMNEEVNNLHIKTDGSTLQVPEVRISGSADSLMS